VESVYSAVRTESLYKTDTLRLKGLITGPVTDDFCRAYLWSLLAFALELRKIKRKFRIAFFRADIQILVISQKISQ
jgi:hypothetical protein